MRCWVIKQQTRDRGINSKIIIIRKCYKWCLKHEMLDFFLSKCGRILRETKLGFKSRQYEKTRVKLQCSTEWRETRTFSSSRCQGGSKTRGFRKSAIFSSFQNFLQYSHCFTSVSSKSRNCVRSFPRLQNGCSKPWCSEQNEDCFGLALWKLS